MTDGGGVPLGALVTAGQAHESKSFAALLDTVRIGRRSRPLAVAGDKGYSSLSVRTWLAERGIKAVIPTRCTGNRGQQNKR